MSILQNLFGLFAADGASQIPPSKRGYIGEWKADGMDLSIAADGEVRFRQITITQTAEGSTTKARNVSGPIARWEGDSFVVGLTGSHATFQVDAPPSAEGRMTVNGVELTRQA